MTREGIQPKRLLAVLVAVLVLAASLSACGDSGSDDSSESTTTAGSTATAQDAGDKQGKSSSDDSEDQGKQQGGSPGNRESNGGDSGSGNVATAPLKVSGGGSEQFRTKGGDNSVQEYGDEGDESELQEVAEIVHGFYVARIEERWDSACSYLAKSTVEQLEQVASQSPQFKGEGCGPILKAFTRPLPASTQREITTVDAGSFRHEGEQGFLIYTGAEGTVYAMPLRSEDGSWKVAALSGSAIG